MGFRIGTLRSPRPLRATIPGLKLSPPPNLALFASLRDTNPDQNLTVICNAVVWEYGVGALVSRWKLCCSLSCVCALIR